MALLEAGQTLLNGLPPYGGSGLKCKIRQNSLKNIMSPSIRREWIEMSAESQQQRSGRRLPLCGGSGLKYC